MSESECVWVSDSESGERVGAMAETHEMASLEDISECLDVYFHRFIIRYFNYFLLLPGFERTTYFMTVQLVIHSTRFPLK